MIFYFVNYPFYPPSGAIYPCILLGNDNWNDYGYRTLFHFIYHKSPTEKINFGYIKILQTNSFHTSIPDKFNQLGDDYCFLAEADFYKLMREHFKKDALSVLSKINDCATNIDIYKKFKNDEGFAKSLLRTSSFEKALKEGLSIIKGENRIFNANFTFRTKLDSADDYHTITFNFDNEDEIPNRLQCLIGKNGTGKTQVLARIALGLSGQRNDIDFHFDPGRPLFNKVIAVSFSIFDEFEKPLNTNTFNYEYIGNKLDGNTILQKDDINRKLYKSIHSITRDQHKKDFFKKILSETFSLELHDKLLSYLSQDDDHNTIFGQLNLSSGQHVLFNFISRVLSELTEDSLILFDEPEIHLHPNAISKIINALYELLEYSNSFAIIATHSPIIVQQIPAKYIKVFERTGSTPEIRDLDIESFGENLNSITENIFQNINELDYYKTVLKNLKKENMSYNKLKSIFKDDLNFHALMYYRSLDDEEA